jgi:hypothetical protein
VCGEANPAYLAYCKVCEAKLDTAPQPTGKRYKEKVTDERRFVRVGVLLGILALGAFLYWLVGVIRKPLTAIHGAYHSDVVEEALGQ